MDTNKIKEKLRSFYNQEAEYRNSNQKQEWKKHIRDLFCQFVKDEGKESLLEIGAGTGQDSRFFIDCGLAVTAIDFSIEMVKLCREKAIEAYEMDFYDIASLNRKFDCIWSMNSLLHVPKEDLPKVLQGIDHVMNQNGLFFMGVYGGRDTETYLINEISDFPRFYASYSESELKTVLEDIFDIIRFCQFDVENKLQFQAVIMRKR